MTLPNDETSRESECPHRWRGQCHVLNAMIGWSTALPLAECDKCWQAGRDTDRAAEIRSDFHQRVVQLAKANTAHLSENVLRTLIRDYLTIEEAEKLVEDQGAGWSQSRPARWAAVQRSWEMAKSFSSAMMSKGFAGTRADDRTKSQRWISCFGQAPDGAAAGQPCDALRWTADHEHAFCGDCGCGDHRRAHLNGTPYGKLEYPYLECPRGRPGFSNEGKVSLTVNRDALARELAARRASLDDKRAP